MGIAKRGALAGVGWVVWTAASKVGWRYATNTVDQRKQTTDSAESPGAHTSSLRGWAPRGAGAARGTEDRQAQPCFDAVEGCHRPNRAP